MRSEFLNSFDTKISRGWMFYVHHFIQRTSPYIHYIELLLKYTSIIMSE